MDFSRFDPDARVLATELKGSVDVDDVERWQAGLRRELARVPDDSTFKLLLDLHGYEPAHLDAHKAMRNVIPTILASHGMRPAFVDLFDRKPELDVVVDRGVRCVAFANVHHDPDKMANYESRIAKPDQRFFTDRAQAESWLATL